MEENQFQDNKENIQPQQELSTPWPSEQQAVADDPEMKEAIEQEQPEEEDREGVVLKAPAGVFIPYNTDMKRLRLPEYGRKIHELIQFCKLIEDREERNACAQAIADVMARCFPSVVGENGDRRKIWDHINIMADFELDVDFPVEVLSREQLQPKPAKLRHDNSPVRRRHYGRTLELMVDKISQMEDSEQRDMLIHLVANQMKKQLLAHNKEVVSDAKVLKDLRLMSAGTIDLDPQTYPLHEYSEFKPVNPNQKKKRK